MQRKRLRKKGSFGPIDFYEEGEPEEGKKKKKKKTRQVKKGRAGSYLTTRGQKKKKMDEAFDYTLE